MTRNPKKSKLIQARIPYSDYQSWVGMCEGLQTTVSEALRAAMADYADKFGRRTFESSVGQACDS
jgi:hypothetical protein